MTEFAVGPATSQGQDAPAIVTGPGFGSFRFWFATKRWEWSPEVYLMHGYVPGEVEPTTDLLLSHKHPDDRPVVAEAIARSLNGGNPFSSRHRFVDTQGRIHPVLLISDGITDSDGKVVGTTGYYIDLTDTLAAAEKDTLDSVLPELLEARVVIEQAKGALMGIYRITETQAFEVLRWRSRETSTKLRDLAQQLLFELTQTPGAPADWVTRVDHLLLTVHERVDRTR